MYKSFQFMDFCRNLDRAKEVAPVRAGSQRLLETAQTGRICNIDIIELLFRGVELLIEVVLLLSFDRGLFAFCSLER